MIILEQNPAYDLLYFFFFFEIKMKTILLFILGLIVGINIGFMIMIPEKNAYKKLSHECVDSYSNAFIHFKTQQNSLKQDLIECKKSLNLFQGHSR